jgi:hypothetical protein
MRLAAAAVAESVVALFTSDVPLLMVVLANQQCLLLLAHWLVVPGPQREGISCPRLQLQSILQQLRRSWLHLLLQSQRQSLMHGRLTLTQ